MGSRQQQAASGLLHAILLSLSGPSIPDHAPQLATPPVFSVSSQWSLLLPFSMANAEL